MGTLKKKKDESDEMFRVRDAINTIIEYGEKRVTKEPGSWDHLARGFGVAIAPYFTPRSILHIAGEALEDQNAHKAAEVVRTLISYNKPLIFITRKINRDNPRYGNYYTLEQVEDSDYPEPVKRLAREVVAGIEKSGTTIDVEDREFTVSIES